MCILFGIYLHTKKCTSMHIIVGTNNSQRALLNTSKSQQNLHHKPRSGHTGELSGKFTPIPNMAINSANQHYLYLILLVASQAKPGKFGEGGISLGEATHLCWYLEPKEKIRLMLDWTHIWGMLGAA